MKTKEKIIEVSKQLFNQYGAHKITTNHIAAEMKISPGNFYYHYRNKEQIIKTIFYEINDQMDKIKAILDTKNTTPSDIADYFIELYEIIYQYSFFFLELPILLDRDPDLKEIFVKTQERRLNNTIHMFGKWMENGIMIMPFSQREISLIAQNIWIVGQFWLSYVHINDDKLKITRKEIKQGILQIVSVLRPHFTHQANEEFEQSLIAKLK